MAGAPSKIHPTAIIDPAAQIAANVEIGPYCVISANVSIGEGTVLHSHVNVTGWTTIGKDCIIYPFAAIGGDPQDLKFAGEKSYVVIGDRVKIHEYVTVHRGTGEETVTRIGNDVLLMACSHVAHNCKLGNRVIAANYVGIAGHAIIEDNAIIGGMSGIHQFTKVGRNAMIGGMSRIVQDIPPFVIVGGNPSMVMGLNSVGIARAGIPPANRSELKKAYKILYRSGLALDKAIETMEHELIMTPEVEHLLRWLRNVDRGICRGATRGEEQEVLL